ncbi:MucR family transcriptional regulator [Phenylobacterium sp.]|uniref:MucR family transcriptional regulator n=1 Tax=Phenylobacterium sp. TaxID=1871053 RepID=UPI00273008E9|nr:MucR family transcriptional regulator [Phenylobacterium sp.]MDP1600128.1 MucR family transcriptional regulator [Phenylobacterium sp.]MDP3592428.1 MucR family transcriptional regulator [Phenylobacterium sp.]
MSIEAEPEGRSGEELMRLGADIVAAYVSRNSVSADAVPDIIRSVYGALEGLNRSTVAVPEERPKPAVPINRSIQHDFIVCLEDGKKLKMLKRYLRSRYDMSPDDYRRRWGLPPDYPMVAPAYAARRSAFAKEIGLGRGVRRGK